ncbi:hypothetical protein [Sphingomonas sp. Leaf4]|uniref:hypothetical protein n=1 Tax=Sphingomonas sp. Leaf4 TaxID=2876553 RepID=UPI001E536401|nr:hypothetical protein [Sphingomonas sp. Leaf4]
MSDDHTASAPAAATDDLRPPNLLADGVSPNVRPGQTQADPVREPLPDGDYAIVEVLGHRTIIGRVTEVERFGTKLMAIEPIFAGALLAPVLVGGGSLYQYTPCSREVATARAPSRRYGLPSSIAAMLPPEADATEPALLEHRFPFLDDDSEPM